MWARISWACSSASAQSIRWPAWPAMSMPARIGGFGLLAEALEFADAVALRRPRAVRRECRSSVRGAGWPPASAPVPARAACPARWREFRPSSSWSIGSDRRSPSRVCDLFGQVLADALEVGQLAIADRRRCPATTRAIRGSCGRRCDRPGRETGSPPGLQQVGDLLECGGDFDVGHDGTVHIRAIRLRPCRAARSRP